jgi:hypothetical protein
MTMRLHPPYLQPWPALALALSLAGCLGTSTGNPTEDPGEEHGGGTGVGSYCKEASSRPVPVDEQTSLGFSAQQVLEFVEGEQQETLTWHAQPLASYGPESGEQQATLTVTRRDTPIRLVQYRADTGGAEIAIGSDCSDALAIDVHVALRTAGGALDESFDATLVARSSRKVSIYQRLDHKNLGGSFAITQFHQPRFRVAQMHLAVTWTPFGTTGALNVVFEQPSEDGTAVGSGPGTGPLASWGPASCGPWSGDPVPLDQPVAGFSGNDVLALLASVDALNVAWSGAPASSASVAFALSGGVCAQLEPAPFSPGNPDVGSLILAGVLSVRSQDGRIDAAWPVQVNALPNEGGALDEVKLAFDDQRLQQQGSLQARYGLSGIDASAYDFSSASFTLTLSPAGALTGELRVTGYTLPMCSTEPIRNADGQIVGSPGCQGATPTELAKAQLSAGP